MLSEQDRLLLQDYLDGRLEGNAAVEVERRLERDERLRREADMLRTAKGAAPRAAGDAALPPDLLGRIREDRVHATGDLVVRRGFRGWFKPAFAGLGLALLLVALGPFFLSSPEGDMTTAVAHDFYRYRNQELTPCFKPGNLKTLRKFCDHNGVAFDFGSLDTPIKNYTFVHGTLDDVAGRPSIMLCYETPDGANVVCQMYKGAWQDLPKGGTVQEKDGARVMVYAVDALTLAFWEEDGMLCAITSDGDAGEAVSLALARAAGKQA